jgi:uncharacterized integral membrane protein
MGNHPSRVIPGHPPRRDSAPVASQPTAPQPSGVRPKAKSRRDTVRLTLAVVIGALGAVFVVLNLGAVNVNWIVGSGSTPLIIVIVLWFLIGMATDRILVVRAGRKRARRASTSETRRPPTGES